MLLLLLLFLASGFFVAFIARGAGRGCVRGGCRDVGEEEAGEGGFAGVVLGTAGDVKGGGVVGAGCVRTGGRLLKNAASFWMRMEILYSGSLSVLLVVLDAVKSSV